MARLVPLLSNLGLILGGLLLFSQCQQPTETAQIPRIFVSADQPGWQQHQGRLLLNNSPFSGWQYQLWASGDTSFVGAYHAGKPEGFHRRWYANGQQQAIRYFKNGWQEGEQRGWFESGRPAFLYHFQNDVYEGNLKEWLPNGQLAKVGNYHEGKEEGAQQQWFVDGSLKVNYVVRNGRNYGFTGVKNCINVRDSLVAY